MSRLLQLSARLPGALLPFAAALSLSVAGWWIALGAGAAAVAGYFLSPPLSRLLCRWVSWRNLLLSQTVIYVLLVVLLLTAAEQGQLALALSLSILAGAAAPAERVYVPRRRLDRTAIGLALLLALICGLLSAWSVPLVVCGVLAAVVVPILVMLRFSVTAEESPSPRSYNPGRSAH